MKTTLRWLPIVAMITVLTLGLTAVQAQDDGAIGSDVSLTVYNQGTALVQDRRTFTLTEGENIVNFTDVAALIDATSVVLSSLTDPDGMQVLEQNYIYDLVDTSALLQRYLDQRIEVFTADGATFEGQLLSGAYEIILREDDGNVVVISQDDVRDIRFPDLPSGLITRPTLRWLLWSGAAGDQQVELTYLTGGMSWTADYNFLLNSDNSALDLNGWVTLTNTSGTSYNDAQVKLIAGDVNRLPDQNVMVQNAPMAADGIVSQEQQQVEQRDFYEYHLYEITRPVTVGNNETKQVEFVTGADIPAHTFYVYNASYPFYGYSYPIYDQYYGNMGITDVQNYLEFTTGEENGLGADLPAGRVRVYQEDVDGAALLIGENTIDHTPEGEDVQIYLGNAFDLVGEHIQSNFRLISDTALEESFEIHLRNRKDDQTVEIRVPETLYRWSNWEIVEASHDYEKVDSHTIEFRVPVEPQGETVITYTVRYTWPK